MFESFFPPKLLLAAAGALALSGCQYLPFHKDGGVQAGTPRAAATASPATPADAPSATVAAAPAAPANPWWEKLKPGSVRCEMGQGFDVRKVDTASAVEMVWQKRDYVLKKVNTTTGAYRYEDPASGLVLIQIPAKMLLLNSKLGQRLADECQMAGSAPLVAAAAAPAADQPAAKTPAKRTQKTTTKKQSK